jgi:hypothetical protein
MKQIYNFEQHTPPILNENMILAELERRKERRQIALLTLAGILAQSVVLLLGFLTADLYPLVTMFSIFYTAVTTAGGGVIAAAYAKKRRETL